MSDASEAILAVSGPLAAVAIVVGVVLTIAWGSTHVESEAIAAGYVQKVVVTSRPDGGQYQTTIWTKPPEPTTEQSLRVEAGK